ncbi:hypothetical protein PZ938_04445 [Luteipulveratus sp. YIM 133132]|uniref:ClpX-type ZB domain-containing protein n=1 Tax=Luteipulveratus flavus TaxID=3031728 RepID=A0ABT6CB26_9MICO|nr:MULTISPECIES: hypothetical protein [unclassified Luteipulveratus]MDE9364845.1 hypothetical protein [Luteipulveratus sp. YIM 133132]MDF8265990.1 hypothetical protein [Luteipulveratus sp. YIM 133296]
MTWELDFLEAAGRIRHDVATQVDALIRSTDAERATELVILIESSVAPVSGGLADDAGSVATAVVAGLAQMHLQAKPEALLLLTQILGSSLGEDGIASVEVREVMEASLPVLAAAVESGSGDDMAQGVDLISLSAHTSEASAQRAAFYLSRLSHAPDDQISASAEREMGEVRGLMERRQKPDRSPHGHTELGAAPVGRAITCDLTCLVCGPQGLLVFMKRVRDGLVLVECQECLAAYWDPEDVGSSFRGEDIGRRAVPARREDISARGLSRWVGHELD